MMLLILGLATPTQWRGTLALIQPEDPGSKIAYMNVYDALPDPQMDSPPTVIVNGTSDAFQWKYLDTGVVEFNWTHEVSSFLNFRDPTDNNLPDSNDFIYLTQSFDWPYDELPSEVYFYMNYSISVSGDFLTDEFGDRLFEVLAWTVDSAGWWDRIYESQSPYSSLYEERAEDLAYSDLVEGWGGMIEFDEGVQQDPEDRLTLAIGLSPTEWFRYDPVRSVELWQMFEGEVLVRIESANLYVFIEAEREPSMVQDPLFNTTWSSSVRQVFPQVLEEYDDARDFTKNVETADDGSVYVLVDSSSPYIMYAEMGLSYRHQTLLKFDARLNPIWSRNHENQTLGFDVAFHGGYIYTAGARYSEEAGYDSLVTRWSQDGSLIWQHSWDSGADERAGAVGVTEDGSVYVYGTSDNWREIEGPYIMESFLLKYDSAGNFLWNKTIEIPSFVEAMEMTITTDGIYLFEGGWLSFRDFSGNEMWFTIGTAYTADDQNNLYVAYKNYLNELESQLEFVKYGPDHERLWSCYYSINLADRWKPQLECDEIEILSDGSLVTLVRSEEISLEYHLVKIDGNGTLLSDAIVNSRYWPMAFSFMPPMSVGSGGLCYIAFTTWPTNTSLGDARVVCYEVGEYEILGVPWISIPEEIYIVVGGGALVLAVIALILQRRKTS